MKCYTRYLALTYLYFFSFECVNGQDRNTAFTSNITLSRYDFDSILYIYKASMSDFNSKNLIDVDFHKDTTFSESDCIMIVRLINTIQIYSLCKQYEMYCKFYSEFTTDMLYYCLIKLHGTLSKCIGSGGCYYSDKYNLYITGPPNENSYYKIR